MEEIDTIVKKDSSLSRKSQSIILENSKYVKQILRANIKVFKQGKKVKDLLDFSKDQKATLDALGVDLDDLLN